MAPEREYLIALGANLGNAADQVRTAIERFGESVSGITLVRASRIRITAPVGGPPGQTVYANAAVLVTCDFEPDELLRRLKRLESDYGRTSGPTWSSRPLDLDILACESLVVHSPTLTIPHPRLTVRRFALDPLAEIAPDWVHPQLGAKASDIIAHHERAKPVVALGRFHTEFPKKIPDETAFAPWTFVLESPDAAFDVRPLAEFDPEQHWNRPRFYPTSDAIDSVTSQVLAVCSSLRPIRSNGSN
jgi:2-amino-4-hydroxy-6-hydroxymethyldihydropteridine diphosphokinase